MFFLAAEEYIFMSGFINLGAGYFILVTHLPSQPEKS
jgi:hypothetical protein